MDGFINQKRPIVDAANFYSAKFRFERCDFCFDIFDDRSRILAVSHHHNAADSFRTVQVQGTSSESRACLNGCQIANSNRYTVIGLNNGIADLSDGFFLRFSRPEEAFAANEVLHARRFSRLGTDLRVGCLNRHQQLVQCDIVVAKFVGIDFDLILANVATDGRDFRDSIDRFQGEFHNVVLQRSQTGQIGIRCRFQYIVKNLSQTSCVWAEYRRHAFWDFPRRQRKQLFGNS